LINKALLRPKLEKNPQMGQMDVDYDLPWADRWAEIEQVENEHKRLAWMVKWHTGMRGRMVRGLLWSDIDMHAGTMLVSTGLKKVKGKRLIAMSARVHDMFRRLHEIKMDDCDWVFPSRRIVGDARGPLDALDRLELTTEGTLRHLWNVASQDVETREMVLRWLCGHALTDGDTKNLGLYGMVPVERQRKVANLISTIIDHKCRVSPANVVEIGRTGT
jgi:integrase